MPVRRTISGNYARRGKRILDLALAVAALLLLAPVILLTALAILLVLGRPVFFVQRRPGRDGRLFTLVKFRTLLPEREDPDDLVGRRTWLGDALRRTGLDELPQLWNVVRGDMSLVGPRPLLPEYLELYSPEQTRRHEVRPGLTGWAQVQGRNETTWEERLRHDVWYVDHVTAALDLRILLRTLVALGRSDGGLERAERLGRFRGNDVLEGRGDSDVD